MNAPSPMTPHSILAAARLLARQKRPYFTDALLALVPYEMHGLGTMAVTKDFVLMWDPATIKAWGVENTAGVLLHEIEHPLRSHHDRMARIGATNKQIANIATDAEINDDLVAGQLKLPDDPVTPQSLGLPVGRMAEEYYNLLRQQEEQRKPPPGGDGPPLPPDGSMPNPGGGVTKPQDNKPEDKPQDGKPDSDKTGDSSGGQDSGMGGSDSGSESSPSDGAGNSDGDATNKPGKPGSGGCGSSSGAALEAESKLPPELGRTRSDIERVRRQTADRVRQAASSGKGDIPGGLVRWANEQLKPPKVPWQSKLARLARRASTFKPGAQAYRRDRMSRRQAGVGFGHGSPMLAVLRDPVPKVAVVIDTSGSMGTDELNRAVSETAAVLKAAPSVEFLASDARVHEVKSVRNIRDVHKLLVGGGGTDFRPVFKALEQAKHRPDVTVFITDGIGPAPVNAPKDMTVIWLLVGRSRQKPYTGSYGGSSIAWGEFIEVDD